MNLHVAALCLLALVAVGASASWADLESPLAQLKSGTAPEDVLCNEGLVLVIRAGDPACLRETTAQSLGLDPVRTEPPATDGPGKILDWMRDTVQQFTGEETDTGANRIHTADEIRDLFEYGDYSYLIWHGIDSMSATTADIWIQDSEQLTAESAGSIRGGASVPVPAGAPQPPSHSVTNVQVQGVDEPDFLKSDGGHVYVLVRNELEIVDAYPAPDAEIVFESDFDAPGKREYEHMFLSGDRLAVIFEDYAHRSVPLEEGDETRTWAVRTETINVMIVDVSDRSAAEVVAEYSIDGWYHDARMIDGTAYIITQQHIDPHMPVIPEVRGQGDSLIPDMYYFDSGVPSVFTVVSAVRMDTDGDDAVSAQTYLLGEGDTIYVSEDSIYLTQERHAPPPGVILDRLRDSELLRIMVPLMPNEDRRRVSEILDSAMPAARQLGEIAEIMDDARGDAVDRGRIGKGDFEAAAQRMVEGLRVGEQRTAIHKLDMLRDPAGRTSFVYAADGEVAGHVLNQFSMDEHDGRFRIATTFSGASGTHSNVFVLDENLEHHGSLEGIAPTESIYSARFVGDRLYLVTFRQVDPFFVIDVSAATPRILGELKIPGFSTYLHPYGEDRIIGIGQDVGEGGMAGSGTGGVKLAMFDVSDPGNPRLQDTAVVGGWDTWSQAQDDHRAVLVDEGKAMISVPMHHGDPSMHPAPADPGKTGTGGDTAMWDGFYVYGITSDGSFDLAGTIRHDSDHPDRFRSLYIEDHLYTVTDNLMRIHDLDGLDAVKSLILN